MQIAIDYSIGDFIIEIHDVGTLVDDIILHQIYQQSQIGYDIVFANANKTKISSTLFYKLLKLITKDDYYSTPIYMLSRRAINLYKNNKHKFAKIQYKHLGLSWVNIYFNNLNSNHDDRSIGIKLNNAINIFLIYTSLGFNISAIISIVFGLISLIFGSYALLTFIFLKKVQTGWASTAIFLSFGFFGIFLLLSMIIKYLELILKYNLDNSNPNLQTIEKIQHD
jgi:dolichol-phosphate mannosyltransferase